MNPLKRLLATCALVMLLAGLLIWPSLGITAEDATANLWIRIYASSEYQALGMDMIGVRVDPAFDIEGSYSLTVVLDTATASMEYFNEYPIYSDEGWTTLAGGYFLDSNPGSVTKVSAYFESGFFQKRALRCQEQQTGTYACNFR